MNGWDNIERDYWSETNDDSGHQDLIQKSEKKSNSKSTDNWKHNVSYSDNVRLMQYETKGDRNAKGSNHLSLNPLRKPLIKIG